MFKCTELLRFNQGAFLLKREKVKVLMCPSPLRVHEIVLSTNVPLSPSTSGVNENYQHIFIYTII